MKAIDRLLMKAKLPTDHLMVAIVSQREGGGWDSVCRMYSNRVINMTHSTQEEALEAIRQLEEVHPNPNGEATVISYGWERAAIVIDDIPEEVMPYGTA